MTAIEVRLFTRSPLALLPRGDNALIEAARSWAWTEASRPSKLRRAARRYLRLGRPYPWGNQWGSLGVTLSAGTTSPIEAEDGDDVWTSAVIVVEPADAGKTAYGWCLLGATGVAFTREFRHPVERLVAGEMVVVPDPLGASGQQAARFEPVEGLR